jgi:hypothetical protein
MGMTAELLKEAIKHDDPDGKGLERVITAAEKTLEHFKAGTHPYSIHLKRDGCLLKGEEEYCVLAHAWKDGRARCIVQSTYYSVQENLSDPGVTKVNPFPEVVKWFDNMTRNGAARRVLQLLKEKA